MKLDGSDLKYILQKNGISLTDIACDLKISIASVSDFIWGKIRSRRIKAHIETLLEMKPGTLEVSSERTGSLIKVA